MTLGTGGLAASAGPMREEEDELPLDLGGEVGGDEFADDLGEGPAGDLGDDLDLGGEKDALEVSCPDCGSVITVRLVPEVEAGEAGLDLGGPDSEPGPEVDLDVEGEPEEDFAGPVREKYMESVDPNVIASLLTEDPDIFTR